MVYKQIEDLYKVIRRKNMQVGRLINNFVQGPHVAAIVHSD